MRPAGALAAVALALGCACTPVGRAPPPAGRVAPPPPVAGGAHYRIDAARSEVRILVYRAGPLARLGHSHVLLARGLEGELWLPPDPAAARFRIALPVAALVVDDPAARREEGEEFASEPSAADIDGTRRNLLGPAVLDAGRFATIRLDGAAGRGPAGLVAHVRIAVREQALELEVPVETAADGDAFVVRGGFTVLQSALGLAPFTVGLGVLRVRDDLAVRFRLVAVPAPAG